LAAGKIVIKRVSSLVIGPMGSAEGDCTDVGSVRDCEFGVEATVTEATESDLMDAAVEVVLSGLKATCTITAESITQDNIAMSMSGTISAGRVLFGAPLSSTGGTPNYYTAYVHGFAVDDAPVYLHIKKMFVPAGSKLKLGKEQQLLAITATCLAKFDEPAGEELAAFEADPVDAVAPTVVGWVTAGTPSTVAKTVVVPTTLTFDKPVRSADVFAKVGVFNQTTHAGIAGAWSTDADTTVFTFTPAAAYGATVTVEQFVLAGVRDIAGNATQAGSSTSFVTVT